MLYASINDKPIAEHNFDSLRDFFQEEAFFKFMDHGRVGFQKVAADMVDAFEANLTARIIDLKGKRIPADTHQRVVQLVQMYLTDGFIREGSKGLTSAIYHSHSLVSSVMRGEKI